MNLNGQRIVILGGTSGIGLAVAQEAAAEGARVVVVSSNPARVAEAVARLSAGAEGRALDLLDGAAVEAFFRETGAFDHLVYTAGEALTLAPLAQIEPPRARQAFDLRYWGAVTAVKAARPQMRAGGSIVLTSGVAAAKPHPGWAIAASICSAMEGLTRALAVELAPLRVNIVAAGVVRTPLWRDMDEASREALYASEASRLPVGHVGEADEIAEGYLHLMRQTYATGQVLTLDGGGLLV